MKVYVCIMPKQPWQHSNIHLTDTINTSKCTLMTITGSFTILINTAMNEKMFASISKVHVLLISLLLQHVKDVVEARL